ncbi:MAG: hypothetical protein ACE37H_05415 [Phycisphaeraceae bacterium]
MPAATRILILSLSALVHIGCATTRPAQDTAARWPAHLAADDPSVREVTVVIALSSIVPGGVVGHCGVAVDQRYWDFGPQRVEAFQRLKSIRSDAGPWWDDPDQQWQTDHTLEQVLRAMPGELHPAGSLVAVFRFEVTEEQADAIARFWRDTYERMHQREDRYRLAGRQCASMAAWSLAHALGGLPDGDRPMPAELRWMTPTRLYELLRDGLRHSAGPLAGQPADLTLWQLGADGLEPWRRPLVWDGLGVPELPRLRLAFERLKLLPTAVSD